MQLNLAEFCLSFKEKLKFAIPYKREDFKKIQCTAGFNRHTLQKQVLRRCSFYFVCSFVTRNLKNIFIFLGFE